MANMIKISPEVLRAAAGKQETAAAQMEDLCIKLKVLTSNLEAAWQGNSGEEAANGLAELYDSTKKASRAVEASANKLKQIASLFEAVDEGSDQSIFAGAVSWLRDLIRPIIGTPAPRFFIKVVTFLNIDPDAVRNVSGGLIEVSAALFEIRDIVTESTSGLANDWVGKAYTKYAEESATLVNSLDNLAEAVTEYAAKIRRAADRYEELDEALTQN